MVDRPPLLVIEGPRAVVRARIAAALEDAADHDWHIVRGWAAPLRRDRVVCTGWVGTPDDARRALLAAVAGSGLVVGCTADRETVDRFLDDLRRLGPVEHIDAVPTPTGGPLTDAERALLGLLAEGFTVRQAAAELGVSERTADRRLAAARQRLGVGSTAAAIVAARSVGR
jgi:DNA-binding CsgD family transcriptional regulator